MKWIGLFRMLEWLFYGSDSMKATIADEARRREFEEGLLQHNTEMWELAEKNKKKALDKVKLKKVND